MSLQTAFQTFLSDIEPSKTTVDQISSAHKALRIYLNSHDSYSKRYVRTYLSIWLICEAHVNSPSKRLR